MSHHDTAIPLSVFDPNDDGDGEIEVSFDWSPGSSPSGEFGPPENYDPGSADEFYIVSSTADRSHDERIAEWLDENWERPDYVAEKADYDYERYRERVMERDFD